MKNKNAVSTRTQAGVQTIEFALSDATSVAETALHKALDFCASKMGLANQAEVIECLRQKQNAACGYFSYSLAEQAAEWLGTWDEDIKAVYLFDCDATPEDVCLGDKAQPTPINLIIWSRRKTSALNSLIGALDSALARSYAALGISQHKYALAAYLVDDDDVQNSIGCGAMLSSVHTHPLRVWER